MRHAVLTLAILVCASCGGAAPKVITNSGIEGKVVSGPTCPVESLESPCPERPQASALVRVTKVASDSTSGVTKTDANGNFRVALAPGEYTITVQAPGTFGCKPVNVTVKVKTFTKTTIQCDSGIR